MPQRHPHDSLADEVANVPADVEQKLRRQLYSTKQVIRTSPDGRSAAQILNPQDNEADFETALGLAKTDWARRKIAGDHDAAIRAADEAARYTCACCTQVAQPGGRIASGHTQRRILADGTNVVVCGDCFPVLESLAVERLAAGKFDGKTRADRARDLLKATP